MYQRRCPCVGSGEPLRALRALLW